MKPAIIPAIGNLRFLAILLALALGALISCGGDDSPPASDAATVTAPPTAAPATLTPPTKPPTTVAAPPTSAPEPTAEVVSTPEPTPDAVQETHFLQLVEPAEAESFVSVSPIEIVGRTRLDAVVTVNDTLVEPDIDGKFSLSVDLQEGPNIIEVVSSVASGEELNLVLVVLYLP